MPNNPVKNVIVITRSSTHHKQYSTFIVSKLKRVTQYTC